MQVRTFTGPNSQAVLTQVKAELGPEAVILSTRTVNVQGAKRCEVTAALDGPSAPQGNGNGNGASPSAPSAPSGDDGMAVAGWGAWHREWDRIKDSLLCLMKPHMDLGQLPPRHRLALEYLEREGVDGDVVLSLFRSLREDPEASVLAALGGIVPVKPWSPEQWPNRFHVVAGPYGTGKTSTLIRMALARRKARQNSRILMVNTDHERGSGRLLLRHYAELSGVDYREAPDALAFAEIVRGASEYDTILIDTPGMARGRSFESFREDMGLDNAGDVHVHLVLSPFYAPAQLAAYERQYYSPLVSSLVWTKLDEACTFGAIVNAAAATRLPVSALSCGAGLNGTLVPAQSTMLWRLLFKHILPA